MKYICWLAALLTGLLVLSGCAGASVDAEPADTSPMIFRVANEVVTENDFRARMELQLAPAIEQLMMQGQTEEQITALAEQENVYQSILDDMIQEELMLYIARQEGIGVDAEDIDASLQQQQSMGVLQGADPDAELSPAAELAQREQLARDQLVRNTIAQHTTADMFQARHILVSSEEAAEDMLTQLEAGVSFGELAREHSTDTVSAQEGGDLGWVPRGNFVPEFEEAAFSAALNAPLIVESQFGYHVIEVLDRQENRPFDDFDHLTSAGNAAQFYEETFLPWFEEIRADAEASRVLEFNADFDPASVPLPFPEGGVPAPPPIEGIPPIQPQPTP